jgi:two-component system sensor histidine kinase NblS
MKDDFISLVSHELRTPLAAIMAYSESLLMENIVEDEKERREYLEIIHSEGERLSRLINDILDLSKMESGKMTYHFEEAHIDSAVYTTMMNFDGAAKQKQLELTSEVEENIPPARFDHDRIVQVLMNLIGNSVKFTEAGGKIIVKAKHVAPDKENNGFIEVSVQDTGCGIPPEQFASVFNKFEQVENVRHHSGGTGLGMPICRQIVEDGHGGKIWFDSKVGVGTTFFFRLPL